ncbi:exported hypothetical protein [uncultured Desulfobacterium sp.]|uniref:Ice-binding protein C-terminal domain-containing protein n=1 Tax=uncultured Desulfobacterium sp. TaxID=201089 RepID=A0A445N325_9BACT|nr:exported hypothetical protein [uncultured Desulfobacterium sp.]
MRKIRVLLILIGICLALATTCKADMLVIDIDPPDSDTNPQWVTPSSVSEEESWLEGLLGGVNVFYLGKDSSPGDYNDGFWDKDVEGDDLMPAVDWVYAILKYGVGKPDVTNPDHWAIIDNDDDNLVDFAGLGLGVDSLSHITYFGPSPVPEPATMMLLGTGLVGLGWFGRRRKA